MFLYAEQFDEKKLFMKFWNFFWFIDSVEFLRNSFDCPFKAN